MVASAPREICGSPPEGWGIRDRLRKVRKSQNPRAGSGSSVIITQKVLGLAIVDGWAEWKMEHPRISGIGGDPYVRCTVYRGLRWDARVEARCNRIERSRDGADEPRGKRIGIIASLGS